MFVGRVMAGVYGQGRSTPKAFSEVYVPRGKYDVCVAPGAEGDNGFEVDSGTGVPSYGGKGITGLGGATLLTFAENRLRLLS
jgi:hypothetical protein